MSEMKFNFNSQICTTREQSERLLALGVKEKTADFPVWGTEGLLYMAWSLHRLIEMGFESLALLEGADDEDEIFFIAKKNPYESMIEMYEWLIKEGYFNKEYLNGIR